MKKKKEKTVTRTKKIGVLDPDTGRIEPFITTTEDSDKAFYELCVMPLLQNKELIQNLLALPDKDSLIRELLHKNDADVSDDEFFAMLKAGGHPILNLPFAQQKMTRWQEEKYNDNKDIASKARDNLRSIGSSLAYVGYAKTKSPELMIVYQRELIFEEVKKLGISKIRSEKGYRK